MPSPSTSKVRAAIANLQATQEEIEVVGEAEDGAEAVRLADELRPDVALLDIRMPVLNGIEAARTILPRPGTATKALMLTTFDLDAYVYDALAAGASGLLLKDATFPELRHAVRGGRRGQRPAGTGSDQAPHRGVRPSAPTDQPAAPRNRRTHRPGNRGRGGARTLMACRAQCTAPVRG